LVLLQLEEKMKKIEEREAEVTRKEHLISLWEEDTGHELDIKPKLIVPHGWKPIQLIEKKESA